MARIRQGTGCSCHDLYASDARPASQVFPPSLSLQELFCLLTLACVLLALLLSDVLTDEERWLVGSACGSALAGILLARLCSRRAWLAGLALGTLGAAVVVGREATPRYSIYQHLLQHPVQAA